MSSDPREMKGFPLLSEKWIVEKINFFKTVKWMNERACSKSAYVPTPIEHIANVITHGLWIPYSIYGAFELLSRSNTGIQIWAAVVYGLSLLLLFTVSTCFHCVHFSGHGWLKDLLHRGDRAMIYIFIAASYFPWLVLAPLPAGYCTQHLWWFIWVLALLGILYQQMYHEKYRTLETCVYMFVALGPSALVLPGNTDPSSEKIKVGGVIYAIGVVFFKSDGKIPFAHAIWHLFVAGAACVHYHAVLNHLYPLAANVESPASVQSL